MTKFEDLLPPDFCAALGRQGIVEPTEIQKRAIPPILEGKSLVASSETGTGKTLAYLLPIFLGLDPENRNPQAFVVAPTHELAVQVCKVAAAFAKEISREWIAPALLIGGANMSRQLDALKAKPRIIVGSAGRILELLEKRKLTAHFVRTVVLDEGDRLLDDLNLEQTKRLVKTTLRDRRTLIFSASINGRTLDRAGEIAPGIEYIDAKAGKVPESISHFCCRCEQRDKIKLLRKIFHGEKIKKGIVFFTNPADNSIVDITERLNFHGIPSAAIYGGMLRNDRRNALDAFGAGRVSLMAASDVAARGLDIPGVTHVICYDMPESGEIYAHRAGRAGRMGEAGVCISLVNPSEERYVAKIERDLGIKIIGK